jgi:hypothetical protein
MSTVYASGYTVIALALLTTIGIWGVVLGGPA